MESEDKIDSHGAEDLPEPSPWDSGNAVGEIMEALVSGRLDSAAYQTALNQLETDILLSIEESRRMTISAIENARTFDGRSEEHAAEINEQMDSAQLSLGLTLARLFEGIQEQTYPVAESEAETEAPLPGGSVYD